MLTKDELKEKLAVLAKKYKALTNAQVKEMSEDDTRAKFIDKLLIGILGWDENLIERQKSLETESNIKYPDYWYPTIPKIIVEAKKLKATDDIEWGKFDSQVQNYAYSKAVNWAVLTNFKLFRAWYITRDKIYPFCDIDLVDGNPENILDQLMWFQSENILNGSIDEEAKRRGIRLKKIDIAQDFAYNLNTLRTIINNYFKNQYKRYTAEQREELTQGLINRLIFIKKTESDGIEPNELEEIYRNVSHDIYEKVIKVFTRYRKKYDTDIFGNPDSKSELESIEIWDQVIKNLLEIISKPKSGTEYNFAAIDVDVLGTIYESYLAYIQKGVKLTGGKTERKEHGIYYTPKYIVDYIVKNTVAESLKNSQLNKVESIKILDPACGSGSFLISVISDLDAYYTKNLKGYNTYSPSQKLELIKNNIYGVDLDERAVQIAKLSIYLKILSFTKQIDSDSIKHTELLPELKSNIKNGNSLIDDTTITDKAFKWNEEFKQIADNGFDVVVGNPPYFNIKSDDILKNSPDFKMLSHGVINSASLFMKKSLDLLKDDGYLGFIIPKSFAYVDSWKPMRNYIYDNAQLIKIVDVSKAFREVLLEQVIVIIKKHKPIKDHYVELISGLDPNKQVIAKVKYGEIISNNTINFSSNTVDKKLYEKINKDSVLLSEISTNFRGIGAQKFVGNNKSGSHRILSGKDVQCYHITDYNNYFINKRDLSEFDKAIKLQREKIVVQNIVAQIRNHIKINATYDEQGLLDLDTVNNIIIEDANYDPKYILALLNSKLIAYYVYNFIYSKAIRTMHFDGSYSGKIPIKAIPIAKQQEFVKLVDKLLEIGTNISELKSNGLQLTQNIKERFEDLQTKLDERIFHLYDINDDEIDTIIKSFK